MKFAFPILTAKGEEFRDAKELTSLIKGEQSGHYLLGNHQKWHGGIHISDASAPWCKDQAPIRVIADGKVVAYRMLNEYLVSEFKGESLRYSNCFCLVQHDYCEINPETNAKNEFTFYSLYMHLLPWTHCQRSERLVLKRNWHVRNSVPHLHPSATEKIADDALPSIVLPASTELERISGIPSRNGTVGNKDYSFIQVTIKSQLSDSLLKEGERNHIVLTAGSPVWLAMDDIAVAHIKPNLPIWLFDQVDAELVTNMAGRADPAQNDRTGQIIAGDKHVVLPAGTRLRFDAHRLEYHWIAGKARKMARCRYLMTNRGQMPGDNGVAWVCVEDEFIQVNDRQPSHLDELYVLPVPVAVSAGDTIGYLGLLETPRSLLGGKQTKYQVHLEVFTQDQRLDDVLANTAKVNGGVTYAKIPGGLTIYEKKSANGKNKWIATTEQTKEMLVESPSIESNSDNTDWLTLSPGKYVKKEKIELLSQHDWVKLGFKKIDGSGSDGYLDPGSPSAFFIDLVNSIDSNQASEPSSEVIRAVLQDSRNAETLHRLIVKHTSEWYEQSSANSYQWLEKLKAKLNSPDFDQLVAHEKQRIDKLEWMQSAAKLKLGPEVWHFYPILGGSKNTIPMLEDARVRAFMRMLRVGEGTSGDRGYETLFSGKSFIKDYNRNFSDHPRIKIRSGGMVSSAAGAYQVMSYTWDDPSMVNFRIKYNVIDFSPLSQDMFCLIIFKHKKPGALELIRKGKIESALDVLSYEWASLPPGRYGQPSKTTVETLHIFKEFLEEEINNKTDLHMPIGASNEI